MAVKVVWSPAARADLIDIYVTIGGENATAAERYYAWIEARAMQLAEQPRMGVRRADIRPSARMLVAAPFILLYETIPDTNDGLVERVEIVRVVDGRRDLKRLF
ncbi:type II toxin-antitoxin system RelE/ParE family toxin [Mesorhizobium sp. M1C.F.Ca.ET.193.01.1.1]|uniref:type II toxin-antitoxin system RelE/ParE family toxin n=1 Tax=unclassified Mesorhizobium TaxID=325217 RepID=UPI000FD5F683|nr:MULTISPECIES: type II toxin-antitoxin system RelE/ParE family toxin [unclassified Mesorhizobium]TGS97186.1 type II toxin-antitoxin system RelE/ParE family toxin [bacterium M00.F.Ca.ET.177.01.1.1]TGQ52345.1 type II toxin-antitoxin system RelE/ParE family toxin [Mesorhizobium sp. M1C.F.Ca.ET.210.01.1.1]TGQ68975.1 type II toxin-antitoxin system RelE/ParE family toxin [Mesorhizobium sp. M1C.F.Ca.ET.212.01.1.1]TGR04528.1 type II toxin-antitoxin system RelE/ParE family toxin [Mesorhizobium sp. M1C